MTKNVKHILSAFLVLSLVLCTFAVSADAGEIVFENPLYMQETFEAVKSPLVAESGTSEAYSQYVSAKYRKSFLLRALAICRFYPVGRRFCRN